MNSIDTKIMRLSDLREHRMSEITGMIKCFYYINQLGAEATGEKIINWIEDKEEIHDHWIIDKFRKQYWKNGKSGNVLLSSIKKILPVLEERYKEITNIPVADYDKSKKPIIFNDKSFVFTGRFSSCDKDMAEQLTTGAGGIIRKRITMKTDYLIVGSKCDENWKHSSYGRKIETASRYRKNNKSNVMIIPESKWAKDILKVLK